MSIYRHVSPRARASFVLALVLLPWVARSQIQPVASPAESPTVSVPKHITPIVSSAFPKASGAGQALAAEAAAAAVNGINFHGGQVMHSPINVYFIWYGNWTNDSATAM